MTILRQIKETTKQIIGLTELATAIGSGSGLIGLLQ